MNQVTLHAGGQLFQGEHLIQGNPLRYSGYEVLVEHGCTLRSFFNCLSRYPALVALNPFLESFLEYAAKCPSSGCTCSDIDRLALSRTVEIIGHPLPPRMELSVSLAGFLGETSCDIRMYWLENLLDVPLVLGCLRHVVFGDSINSMEFETVFTLFELIDGICWQLSFHNLPTECRLNF